MDVIDTFLATFIAYIDSGFGLLAGEVAYLSSTLIAIDITLAGLFWALAQNTDVIASLLKKVLYVGFFAWLIGNFQLLATIIFDSFASLGLTAGGSALTAADLFRPGFIAGVGFEAATPLLDEVSTMMGPVAFFENFIMIAIMLVAWAVIMVAFFVLAIQLFITIVEFKLTTLAGFVLVPFALWNKTAFLAERVLGHVITSGIKLMVLAVIIGIGSTLFATITGAFTTAEDVTLAQVMGTVLAALVFLWMGVSVPGLASGLITGAPQLGAGSAAGTVAGVTAATFASGMAARSGAGAALSGTSGALRAGASVAGAAQTAYTLGSALSGKTGAGSVAAGLGSIARAGGDALGRMASSPGKSMREAYAEGSRGAWTATGGSALSGASAPQKAASQSPGWARRFQTEQRISQAGQLAAHALRDGDRASSGAAPSLERREE